MYSNIRAIVREREERLREAMLIVGMSETALYLSWWISYTFLYAIIGEALFRVRCQRQARLTALGPPPPAALLAMLFSLSTLFQFSGAGYIWVMFFLFGCSNAAFAYLISVFFTSGKVAMGCWAVQKQAPHSLVPAPPPSQPSPPLQSAP